MVVAFLLWPFEFWVLKDPSTEKYGDWPSFKLLFRLKYVKNVLLANNLVLSFLKESRGGRKVFWSWFAQIFVDQ